MRFLTLVCAFTLTACGGHVDSAGGAGGCHTGGASGSAASGGATASGGAGGSPCPGSGLSGVLCVNPDCCGPTVADPVALCVQATGGENPIPYLCAGPASENKDGRMCVQYGTQFMCLAWQPGPLELWCCDKAP